jgi:hypothetical protein
MITNVTADSAVWASHYNLLVNAINRGLTNLYDTPAALFAVNMTGVDYATFGFVKSFGPYRYDPDSTAIADGDLIGEATGGGRWILEIELAGALLSSDIQDTLPAVTANLDFASANNQTAVTLTVTVPGARAGDLVRIQPPASFTAGLIVDGWVSAKNVVTARVFNASGGTLNPSAADFTVWVTTPNRIPPITRTAIAQFEALLNGDYDDTTLEALLADDLQAAHFWILLASRWRRQALLDDSPAKTAIQGSAIADAIMEAYEGSGY